MWTEFVLVFALAIAIMGAAATASPFRFLRWMESIDPSSNLWLIAGLRFVFGIGLWIVAPESATPVFLRIFGGLAIAAALGLPLAGAKRVRALLGWWLSRPPGFVRAWGAVAAALGVFVIASIALG